MKSINSLIQHLNVEDDPTKKRQFDSLKQLDDNTLELLNRIKNVEKLNQIYHVECRKSINQSFIVGIGTLTWDLTDHPQFGNMHSNVTNNTEIRIKRDGVYIISAQIFVQVSAVGTYRALRVYLASSKIGAATPILDETVGNHGAVNLILSCCGSRYLYKEDILTAQILSDGGGLMVVTAADSFFACSERLEDLDPPKYGLGIV